MWWARQELAGISREEAPTRIAEEQLHSQGAPQPLLLDARSGFGPPRKLLDPIIDKIGLRFNAKVLKVQLAPGDEVDVVLHYRKLTDAASFLFRFITPNFLRARTLIDPQTHERVYADPYTASELHEKIAALKRHDPTGLLFALCGYEDETNISKNGERTIGPFSIYSMAQDLEDVRKRKPSSRLLLSYFSKVPAKLMEAMSDSRKTLVRKALLRAQMRCLFDGAFDNSMTSLIGKRMVGAHGRTENVYVSLFGISADIVGIHAFTQTLSGEGCWICYARKVRGDFWNTDKFDLRSRESQMQLIGRAWARHPQSARARTELLREYSLHPQPNPANRIFGLDIFNGSPPPLLHLTYHGLAPKLIQCSFQVIQKQVSLVEMRSLGRRIDQWFITEVKPGGWLKTSFNRGFSNYLYGAFVDPLNPWDATIQFGQIASKDVMRDILRHWRLLVLDIFPECPQMLELFTNFLDWMQLIYRKAFTDSSLDLVDSLCIEWKELAVRLFGKEEFELMIKAHVAEHVPDWVRGRNGRRGRGSLLWVNDADGEADHPRLAKHLFTLTNKHFGCEKAMVEVMQRRDALETLLEVLQLVAVDVAAAEIAAEGVAAGDGGAAGNDVRAVLMNPSKRVCHMSLASVAATFPELQQLPWAIALFLQLATGGDSEVPFPAGMPSLTSDSLDVRPGVHVQRWPSDFPAAKLGGTYLHGALRANDSGVGLRRTGERVFVAVDVEGECWYAELVLCFVARYLQKQQFCYVRWLDTPMAVARRAQRPVTARELAGPFETYRWSTFGGSGARGHPPALGAHYGVVLAEAVMYHAPIVASISDGLNAADPLFRLNTDAYIL